MLKTTHIAPVSLVVLLGHLMASLPASVQLWLLSSGLMTKLSMQSSRLPPEAGVGAAAELILKALKLAFAHEQQAAVLPINSHSGLRPLQLKVS